MRIIEFLDSLDAGKLTVFALDYDGVILNSIYEKFYIGYKVYHSINSKSLSENFSIGKFEVDDIKNHPLFLQFKFMVPFIGDIGENAIVFKAINEGANIRGREEFLKYIDGNNFDRNAYNQCAMELRKNLSNKNKGAYIKLSPIFNGVIDFLEMLSRFKNVIPIICTTKPIENIQYYNCEFQIGQYFAATLVASGQHTKAELLLNFGKQKGVDAKDIIFVDDFYRHLILAKIKGIKCFFAEWGFDPMGEALAIKENIPILRLGDL